jgi:TPR repeat protein
LSAAALRALKPLVIREDAELLSYPVTGQDSEALFKWYLLAAEHGDGESQTQLGLMYGKGLGVSRDLLSAHKWFTIASEQGREDAALYRDLVAKLLTPIDLAKSNEKARSWPTVQSK